MNEDLIVFTFITLNYFILVDLIFIAYFLNKKDRRGK